MRKLVLFLIVSLMVFTSYIFAEEKEGIELTIYNQNFDKESDIEVNVVMPRL